MTWDFDLIIYEDFTLCWQYLIYVFLNNDVKTEIKESITFLFLFWKNAI